MGPTRPAEGEREVFAESDGTLSRFQSEISRSYKFAGPRVPVAASVVADVRAQEEGAPGMSRPIRHGIVSLEKEVR